MKKNSKYKKPLFNAIVFILTSVVFMLCPIPGVSQPGSGNGGWYLTGYSFKDGTLQKESVLAGTTSRMKDVISFKGDKGNIQISQNRYDVITNKLLAGVTYSVSWSDPPPVLVPGSKPSLNFSIKTISSSTWKFPQQTIQFNQGMNGVYFVTADGTKYITKDMSAALATDKLIDRGTKGAKRRVQMSFGNGFSAIYNYEWRDDNVSVPIANKSSNSASWHLTGYSFKDGSLQKESVLAGTTSRMKDVISFKGDKGNIQISQNRYDVTTNKLLAGVIYSVSWSDPPAVLVPGSKPSLNFSVKTISSSTWKFPQQTIQFNQGMSGVYFVTADGTKYITKDMSAALTTDKLIDKGTKGAKRRVQMSFGNGFVATYNYEWREL